MVKLKEAADLAKSKGVVVNPIFCGNPDEPDAPRLEGIRFALWRALRQHRPGPRHRGRRHADGQGAGRAEQQAQHHLRRYGALADLKAANQAAQDANALRNGTGGGASRAASKASGLYRNADWDLVDRLKDDPKFDVKKFPRRSSARR